MTLNCL